MMDIVDNPTKVLSETFIMNVFIKYVDVLPPFKEYWEHSYENKRMRVMVAKSGATVLQFAELRKELFHPSDATNAATDERLVELAKVAAQGFLDEDELHDENKATWRYLSISGSESSFQGSPKEVKEGLHGCDTKHDRSESALGRTTHQLQLIGIANAAAVSDAKTNGYFRRFSVNGNKTKGMFHQFDPKMCECLLTVAIDGQSERGSH